VSSPLGSAWQRGIPRACILAAFIPLGVGQEAYFSILSIPRRWEGIGVAGFFTNLGGRITDNEIYFLSQPWRIRASFKGKCAVLLPGVFTVVITSGDV